MKKDRHAMVEVNCAVCNTPFLARKERVEKGMGRYCSEDCYNDDQREKAKQLWGRKDLAKCYKIGGRYCARWYDENGKTCSTSYPRWWWQMNIGEIPEGMIVLLKDNNPLNIDPSNFELGTKLDSTNKGKKTLRENTDKWSAYISKNSRRMSNLWKSGHFDNITGKNHYKWRGGAGSVYPNEFSKSLKNFVKSRDNYQCQICSRYLYKSRSAYVHHRDGNRNNNDQNNLVLLCSSCHGKVHGNGQQSPPIMALREELHWSN